MTPRATDWTLALLVALLFGTGLLSLVSGRTQDAWVFALHGIGGAALGLVAGWKLGRVWRRLGNVRRWTRRTWAGAAATALVAGAWVTGTVWSNGGDLFVAGFNLLNWHITMGVLLTAAVALHGLLRAKRPQWRDLVGRRQVLHSGGIAAASVLGWWLQRPAAERIGWRGAERRWTGSYERGSFTGNGFPATSWVADQPRPVAPETFLLQIGGLVVRPAALSLPALEGDDRLTATLDCTGGFYSIQHWQGRTLGNLIADVEPLPEARYVRIISRTGYRWSFPLAEATSFLLATRVGEQALNHEHGGPVRLVAPGRRGFQWIKWVERVELHAAYDYGAAASTIWSSWTPEGRGEEL